MTQSVRSCHAMALGASKMWLSVFSWFMLLILDMCACSQTGSYDACPEKSFSIPSSNSCYAVLEADKAQSVFRARKLCRTTFLGGDLASFANVRVLNETVDRIVEDPATNHHPLIFYIGLNDIFNEGSYAWFDQSPLDIDIPWMTGYPTPPGNYRDSDCTAMKIFKCPHGPVALDRLWFDTPCCGSSAGINRVICQFKIRGMVSNQDDSQDSEKRDIVAEQCGEDECRSSPCPRGSTCIPRMDSYRCFCRDPNRCSPNTLAAEKYRNQYRNQYRNPYDVQRESTEATTVEIPPSRSYEDPQKIEEMIQKHQNLSSEDCISRLRRAVRGLDHNFTTESAEAMLGYLLALSRRRDYINASSLPTVMSLMSDVTEQMAIHFDSYESRLDSGYLKVTSKSVLEVSNDLLEGNSSFAWAALSPSDQTRLASRLMSVVDETGEILALTANHDDSRISINTTNIRLDVSEESRFDVFFPESWNLSSNVIQISKDNFPGMKEKVVFALYKNIDRLLTASSTAHLTDRSSNKSSPESKYFKFDWCRISETEIGDPAHLVNSKIISASIGNRSRTLQEPVQFKLEHRHKTGTPICAFWSYSKKTELGFWSTEGCWVVDTNENQTTCRCDHLTSFAVLMSVTSQSISEEHQFSLSLITFIGCFISLVCLALAFLTFACFKNLQCDRNTIHKNLVLCLFIAEVIFFVGIGQQCRPLLCSVIAGLLHYFFLASFGWMCMEGVQLYILLIYVFESESSRRPWFYSFAYGLPAVVVGVSAGLAHEGYGTKEYCWLSVDNGLIWAFVGPVVFILMINLVMITIAIYVMCNLSSRFPSPIKNTEKNKIVQIGSWIKAALILIVLLGLTWVFGLFNMSQNSIAMGYIFTIFNSLQGFFIFMCHCVRSEKVRNEYRKLVKGCGKGDSYDLPSTDRTPAKVVSSSSHIQTT